MIPIGARNGIMKNRTSQEAVFCGSRRGTRAESRAVRQRACAQEFAGAADLEGAGGVAV